MNFVNRHFDKRNTSSASNFWNFEGHVSYDLMPFPRDVFRSSMYGADHGSWNGIWPTNLTAAGKKSMSSRTVEDLRREMFSPYGKGNGHLDPRSQESNPSVGPARRRRAGSAPPSLTRKSLSEFVGGESTDPYKTPVGGNRTQVADDGKPETAPAPLAAPVLNAIDRPIAPIRDTRDVSAAVKRWANKSLADLLIGGSNNTQALPVEPN